jgi:hypothetical protein
VRSVHHDPVVIHKLRLRDVHAPGRPHIDAACLQCRFRLGRQQVGEDHRIGLQAAGTQRGEDQRLADGAAARPDAPARQVRYFGNPIGVAWFSLVAAEMVSGQFGLGYIINTAYTTVEYPNIIIGMLTLGVVGYATSAILRAIGGRLIAWRSRELGLGSAW